MRYLKKWVKFNESISNRETITNLLLENGYKHYSTYFQRLTVKIEVSKGNSIITKTGCGSESHVNRDLIGVKGMVDNWIKESKKMWEETDDTDVIPYLVEKGFTKIGDRYRNGTIVDLNMEVYSDNIVVYSNSLKKETININNLEEIKYHILMSTTGYYDD